jgi:hypothetical protein
MKTGVSTQNPRYWVRGMYAGLMRHLVHLNSRTRNPTVSDCAQVSVVNDERTTDWPG